MKPGGFPAVRAVVLALCTMAMLATGACSVPGEDPQQERRQDKKVASNGGSQDPAPQVPESAVFRRERQDVVDEFWNTGRRQLAKLTASEHSAYAREEDDEFVPEGWRLLNVRRKQHSWVNHYVVSDSRDTTISLTSRAESYNDFARKAGIEVGSERSAIAAVEFYLLRTRDANVYRKVVEDADQLHLARPGPLFSENDIREARKKAAKVIAAPAAERSGDGYEVTLSFQEGDTLRAWKGAVASDGTLDGEARTVTPDLPVIFAD